HPSLLRFKHAVGTPTGEQTRLNELPSCVAWSTTRSAPCRSSPRNGWPGTGASCGGCPRRLTRSGLCPRGAWTPPGSPPSATPSKTRAAAKGTCSVPSEVPACTSEAAGLWTWCWGRGDAVTEEQWLASTDPRAMLALARRCGRENDRTLRLFTVACCRRLW